MTPSDPLPVRHDFVRLAADWPDGLLSALAGPEQTLVAGWVAAGRPLVVARRPPDDAPGTLRLGLALPDKRRIGLHVRRDVVTGRRPPPLLTEVPVPPSWRPLVATLSAAAAGAGLPVRVYGSLAWQALTGLDYVRPDRSDIDLLFAPADARALARLPALLRPLAGHLHPRLDGEIVLQGGLAVSWREWLGGGRVLVKAPDTLFLADVSTLTAQMPGRVA
ncbi:malonate decarboxylase holo-[acyl-carrier-protein] synthase [Niveispirillum fermenti]|uniref:malonate decarboxylase holo-[acyl-carrier-protein] synthase n=1 Tax=Niveispirillum fermenti TaxID=1233113 RepID=UPI003A8792F2